jgi:hypothetical protein
MRHYGNVKIIVVHRRTSEAHLSAWRRERGPRATLHAQKETIPHSLCECMKKVPERYRLKWETVGDFAS